MSLYQKKEKKRRWKKKRKCRSEKSFFVDLKSIVGSPEFFLVNPLLQRHTTDRKQWKNVCVHFNFIDSITLLTSHYFPIFFFRDHFSLHDFSERCPPPWLAIPFLSVKGLILLALWLSGCYVSHDSFRCFNTAIFVTYYSWVFRLPWCLPAPDLDFFRGPQEHSRPA